MDDALVKIVY